MGAYHLLAPRSVSITVDPGAAPEQMWDGKEALVVDEVAGFRPRRSCTQTHPMAALDATKPDTIVKHRDAFGFLREGELPASLDLPRVVVVGDSHVDGVVSTADNATSILERELQAKEAPCYVLNAGCGLYSLWQSVLRARDLLPRFTPRVGVVVVFMGTAFLELDNQKVPHLDDDLHELGAATESGTETTSARQRDLAIDKQFEQVFWQGLNQALYLHRDPARIDALARKARHAVDAMESAAKDKGADVLWVLLPSFDLVFPDKVEGLGPLVKEVVQGGAQMRMHDAFREVLGSAGADSLDLLEVFRADRRLSLYAIDFHIYRDGHRVLADALEPLLEKRLVR